MSIIEMDIENLEAHLETGRGSDYGRMMVKFECDANDMFEQISDEVDKDKITSKFMEDYLSSLTDSEKEDLLDEIGKDFCKKHFDLIED